MGTGQGRGVPCSLGAILLRGGGSSESPPGPGSPPWSSTLAPGIFRPDPNSLPRCSSLRLGGRGAGPPCEGEVPRLGRVHRVPLTGSQIAGQNQNFETVRQPSPAWCKHPGSLSSCRAHSTPGTRGAPGCGRRRRLRPLPAPAPRTAQPSPRVQPQARSFAVTARRLLSFP